MNNLILGIHYVINAPFFYYGVSGTILGGFWIGASIYDGMMKETWKGILTVFGYAAFLVLTTVPRVLNSITNENIKHSSPGMEFAGIITIGFIAVYYLIGMLMGVYTIQRARRK
jgi:hypothetical protein